MFEWKVRFYHEGDETGIVDLYNMDLKMDSKGRGEESSLKEYSLETWLWNFKKDPFGFLTVVGEHEGKIVGHMSLFYLDMKIGERTVRASQASGLFVHPDYRGQGIFLAIGKTMVQQAAEEGVPFTFGFPNEPAYHGHLKYGWFDVSMIPVMTTYFDISKSVKAKGIPLAGLVSRLINHYYAEKRGQKIPSEDLRITKISHFDERIDEFWNRVSSNHGMIVIRNRKYLNWRYFEKPNATYDVFLAERNGQIEGYLVTNKLQSESANVGWIIDVLCSSRNVLMNLVHAAIEYLREFSVDSIKCLIQKNQVEYQGLQKLGFTGYPRPKQRLCARINSPHISQMYKEVADEWYVTYGDCDFM